MKGNRRTYLTRVLVLIDLILLLPSGSLKDAAKETNSVSGWGNSYLGIKVPSKGAETKAEIKLMTMNIEWRLVINGGDGLDWDGNVSEHQQATRLCKTPVTRLGNVSPIDRPDNNFLRKVRFCGSTRAYQ